MFGLDVRLSIGTEGLNLHFGTASTIGKTISWEAIGATKHMWASREDTESVDHIIVTVDLLAIMVAWGWCRMHATPRNPLAGSFVDFDL